MISGNISFSLSYAIEIVESGVGVCDGDSYTLRPLLYAKKPIFRFIE